MPQSPGIGYPPDSATSLWRKVSDNLFEIAQANGYSDWLEPNALDNKMSAMRKATRWTWFIAENAP